MKIIHNIKAGANLAPALLVILYYFFVSTDLLTTYLVTPNLKYETNFVIKHLGLSWAEIILFAYIAITINSIIFLVSRNLIYRIAKENLKITTTRILVFYFIQSCFYSHFFISIFVTIHNFLNYIFLFKGDWFLYKLAFSYVKVESIFYPHFYVYTQVVIIIISLGFTAVKIKRFVIQLKRNNQIL